MLRLILTAQFIFCIVSMILTALFALSLSNSSFDNISRQDDMGEAIFFAILFVSIGCCIDLGKYIFWMQSYRSRYYGIISIVLMGFSWLASCAFLVSSEDSLLQKYQIESAEYEALQYRIEAVNQQIIQNERLLEKRLNSAYHKQWAEGQANVAKVAELKEKLAVLIESLQAVGSDSAKENVSTTRFFSDTSHLLNVSVGLVRAICYGLLSLLLEVTTLGMISLANHVRLESESVQEGDAGLALSDDDQIGQDEQVDQDAKIQKAVIQLTKDILQGQIDPVIRKIKAAPYDHLDIDEIRKVLRGLYCLGILEKDKRNSYKLASEDSCGKAKELFAP